MFKAIRAKRQRRVSFVGRHRNAELVGGINQLALAFVRHARIGFQQRVTEPPGTFEFPVQAPFVGDMYGERKITARAIELRPGKKQTRPDARTVGPGFSLFAGEIGEPTWLDDCRHAERQPGSPHPFTFVRLVMAVMIDQTRHDDAVAGVEHAHVVDRVGAVRRHLDDAIAIDDDVDIGPVTVVDTVEQPTGVHEHPVFVYLRRPAQPHRQRFTLSVLKVDLRQPIVGQVSDAIRIAAPARVVGQFVRDQSGRRRQLPVGGHRHDPQRAVDDQRELAAVGRGHRTKIDELTRRQQQFLRRPVIGVQPNQPVHSGPVPSRIRRQRGDRKKTAVGAPAHLFRPQSRCLAQATLFAAGEFEHVHRVIPHAGSPDFLIGQVFSVGRENRIAHA